MSNPNCGQAGACLDCPIVIATEAQILDFDESVTVGNAAYRLHKNGQESLDLTKAETALRAIDVARSDRKVDILRVAVRWQSTVNCQNYSSLIE